MNDSRRNNAEKRIIRKKDGFPGVLSCSGCSFHFFFLWSVYCAVNCNAIICNTSIHKKQYLFGTFTEPCLKYAKEHKNSFLYYGLHYRASGFYLKIIAVGNLIIIILSGMGKVGEI